jgi:hypothetical protein
MERTLISAANLEQTVEVVEEEATIAYAAIIC